MFTVNIPLIIWPHDCPILIGGVGDWNSFNTLCSLPLLFNLFDHFIFLHVNFNSPPFDKRVCHCLYLCHFVIPPKSPIFQMTPCI